MSVAEHQSTEYSARFNLIDEPWLHVVEKNGSQREVSLREALCSAHEFCDVVAELPTMRFAILRIMFAIMYRVFDRVAVEDPEADWAKLWESPQLPSEELEKYFANWYHRFDLLDQANPFLQTPNLRTVNNEWKPVSLIVADVEPEGGLFSMRSELDSLSFAEAARWLIHANAYDYSGIKSAAVGDNRTKGGKGYPMGLGFAGWLGGITLRGDNLRETLVLNLIRNRAAEHPRDIPIWEHATLGPAARSIEEIGTVGSLALLTWPQRRFRLRAEHGKVTGVLVTNGDPIDYTLQSNTELYTSWRFSEPQSQKAKMVRYMPQELHATSAIWQGISTLLPTPQSAAASNKIQERWKITKIAEPAAVVSWLGSLTNRGYVDSDRIIEIVAVGMEYGANQSSYAAVVSDQLVLASALANLSNNGQLSVAHDAVAKAHGAVRALADFVTDLNRAAGDAPGRTTDVTEDAYASLDAAFRKWLLLLKPGIDPHELLLDWIETVRTDITLRMEQRANDAPAAAWAGRVGSSGLSGTRVYSLANAIKDFDAEILNVLGRPARRK